MPEMNPELGSFREERRPSLISIFPLAVELRAPESEGRVMSLGMKVWGGKVPRTKGMNSG